MVKRAANTERIVEHSRTDRLWILNKCFICSVHCGRERTVYPAFQRRDETTVTLDVDFSMYSTDRSITGHSKPIPPGHHEHEWAGPDQHFESSVGVSMSECPAPVASDISELPLVIGCNSLCSVGKVSKSKRT